MQFLMTQHLLLLMLLHSSVKKYPPFSFEFLDMMKCHLEPEAAKASLNNAAVISMLGSWDSGMQHLISAIYDSHFFL